MGIRQKIQAWLQPKDLSLILVIESTPRIAYQTSFPGFEESLSEINIATTKQNQRFYFENLEMLERCYGGRTLTIINGNERSDGKTRFYVKPALRGMTDNIAEDELNALFPNAAPHFFYIQRAKDRDRIYATV